MARKDGKDRGIFPRKNRPGWWTRIYVHEDGRVKEYAFRCSTKTEARHLHDKLKTEQREGRFFPEKYKARQETKAVLLKDYFKAWLAIQPAKGKKITTIETYEGRTRKHVLPVFGDSALSAITRPQLKAWTATLLQSGLDFDTVLNALLTFSGILSEAVEDGLIPVNPALRSGKILKRPKTLDEAGDLEIFTPEEEHAVLTVARNDKDDHPIRLPVAMVFFRTGMRAGEVMGLNRIDLDFRSRRIHVRRNWTQGRLLTPKSGKSRHIDMSNGLADTLKEWIALQDLEAAAIGLPSPEILFPGNIGGTRREPYFMAENHLRYKVWFPLLSKAQVRRLGPHAARHTFASRLISNGENLKYVSEQMGHASIAITVDIYGHLIPGGNRQAVDRLDSDPEQKATIGTGTTTGTKAATES
jgi:integrase